MTDQQTLQQKLWDAAAAGNSAAIRRLSVDEGVDFGARDALGRTALNIASQQGHTDAIKTILAIREARYARSLGLEPAAGQKSWKTLLFRRKQA